MGSLLVITGPPGAGKSTVARIVVDRFEPSVLVAGDEFFGFLARGAIPPWLPESEDQNDVVTRAAAAATAHFATAYTTVYDGVVGPWLLPTFLAAAGLEGLDYVLLLPSMARCVEHVRTRDGHGFTDEDATRKMHDEFARTDIDPRHVIVDPPDPPEAVADRIVAALGTGTFAYGSRP